MRRGAVGTFPRAPSRDTEADETIKGKQEGGGGKDSSCGCFTLLSLSFILEEQVGFANYPDNAHTSENHLLITLGDRIVLISDAGI